jgi:membrane-associated protein
VVGVEQIFQQAISLTGSFNLWLILTIFMLTITAEFGLGIPYLLETIWLLVGYHAMGGAISPTSVFVFCIISLIGREVGASMLYKISSSRINPLSKIVNRLSNMEMDNLSTSNPVKKYLVNPITKVLNKMLSVQDLKSGDRKKSLMEKYVRFSTFNVALGRFSWLKIPITISMGMMRRPLVLLTGVAIFSMAWDALYITLGALGAGDRVQPTIMLASTISGFILINAMVFVIRHYLSSRKLSKVG